MHSVDIFFNEKHYTISYNLETFTLGSKKDSQIINVYSVFIKEPTLIDIVKEHFTLVQDITQSGMEVIYNIRDPFNDEEKLFKVCVAKAIQEKGLIV